MNFYCNECGWTGDIITRKEYDFDVYYFCPICREVMFLSEQELDEYLNYPEPTHIEPFEKTIKGEW